MSSSQGHGDCNGSGSKPFSFSSTSSGPQKKTGFNFQSSRNRPSPASQNRSLPRRPHQLGRDDDSSDEEERAPVHEEISGFDTHTGMKITADGDAISDGKKPLVIPVTSTNNWRDRAGVNTKKSKKNLLPREVQAMQEAQKNRKMLEGGAVETEGPSMAYGLSFAQKLDQENQEGAGVEDQRMPDANPVSVEDNKPLTEDQIALQALLRESKGEVERRTDLVIESSKQQEDDDEAPARYDETSSFRSDVASRPESATLDQYNAIPVEEFGAALLRGMGWKDGQSIGRGDYGSSAPAMNKNKSRVPERRPGFLGIGAKDTSSGKGAEAELGAWGKSAMRKASRKQGEENANGGSTEGVYMPVMMRNKKTGEYITEEELANLKKEGANSQPEENDWRDRRDRNLEKSGRDQDRECRRRDYDDHRSDRRNGSSRRDRSSSAGRHSSRRSRYDDDYRRNDKRSSRDGDRDRDHRRDRHDDHKESRRDRDRDRDRESDRRHRDDRYGSSRHSSSLSSRHDRDHDRDHDSRRVRRAD
ncbi:hypothetical protein N7462_009246 [Penicillium macrosclerotiorum]|uniref:uncharacterized protein n=1 Tax=Penicillium macrosclerotiorum TaxID=303699 RepID=UPI0025479076|nr:uncharacterized protein N7462_009246 [Penicillium macrosclerotiorum]KAJ5673807.1 hypothetical protein N7462_009246 [Penicillium macrosclerotiorum]